MLKKIALAAALFVAAAAPAPAQTWPAKIVHIMVPFGPGSTPDIVARIIADGLKKEYPDSAFVVENKPGASGNIGTDAVAKAAPDGGTIGVSIGGPLAINTLLFSKLPYDPKKDITAVTQLITQPSALAVNPDLKVNTVQDLVTLIKANPGKYNFASIGNGSLSHLAMEAIAIKAGTRLVHLPYPSSPQAVTAIIRNDAQMGCLPAISVVPQAKAGKLKILAVSTAKRSPYLPDVPTLKESGIDVEADAWMGLIAPGGMPKPMVDRINKDVVAIIKQPDVKQKLGATLMEPVGSSPEDFRALIDREVARWAPVIKAANVKVN
ncbi:MAG TPA: tripartite tricarboxylate transporter substrate binding protein [Pseudolabrys sp.]|uniref:Bug family tripartite tricarboxylate transporter substrate binding protein n=1 Tax=Pseudolabrys sp. TaxID=1960880 RepID=UPI002DDD9750|nr:tripartite tricarboxylate transporter substrate binding protein [Pseudolabrys sp.]HEV2628895.1 tripartite tricarboxylate transporter substrate binding protein [Pseudolabrys sp.]